MPRTSRERSNGCAKIKKNETVRRAPRAEQRGDYERQRKKHDAHGVERDRKMEFIDDRAVGQLRSMSATR